MTRRYETIWQAIKDTPVGNELAVKVHGTAAKTLRQGVLKEKSAETAQRKKLGLRFAGRLEIREVTEDVQPSGYCIIYFKLSWDGNRL